jgi:hypothetical protein
MNIEQGALNTELRSAFAGNPEVERHCEERSNLCFNIRNAGKFATQIASCLAMTAVVRDRFQHSTFPVQKNIPLRIEGSSNRTTRRLHMREKNVTTIACPGKSRALLHGAGNRI